MKFKTCSCTGELMFCDTCVVKYDISYPQFYEFTNSNVINVYNKSFSDRLMDTVKRTVYIKAVEQYKILIKYNSFTHLEVKTSFDIMYTHSGILSVFYDIYEANGAEGNVMRRYSQNWDVGDGKLFGTRDLFDSRSRWRNMLSDALEEQVRLFEKEIGCSCFPGWRRVVKKSVDTNKFYLTEDGMAVYCPQGMVAPSVWGIPTFIVPFKRMKTVLDKKFL